MYRRSFKNKYLLLFLVIILCISVGYALLNRNLLINGTSSIEKPTWDIHFENVQIKEGSVTATSPPTIDNTHSIVNFSFTLNLPGDFYEFTIDVVNNGTIDAMIENFNMTPYLSESMLKVVNVALEYENGKQISKKDLLKSNETTRFRIRVEYRKDIEEAYLPTESPELTSTINIIYTQADETAIDIGNVFQNKEVNIISGDLETVGSEFCIDTECFYVAYTEGNTLGALAKYNLYVGYNVTNITWDDQSIYTEIEEQTGLQNPLAKGFEVDSQGYKFPWIASYPFSINKDSSYENSDIKIIIDYYGNYMSDLGYSPTYSLLLNLDILEQLGCSEEENTCLSSEYNWLYSTSYWTLTSYNSINNYVVGTNGILATMESNAIFGVGIRPFLIFNKHLLK